MYYNSEPNYINALHAGIDAQKLKINSVSSNITGAILKTTAPILGLFVLIWIHFHAESKYGNENLNSENLWKSWPVVCTHRQHREG